MSYCRWNDGALYIYEDIHGGITCCGCTLLGGRGPDGDWPSFNCPTRSAMIAHIEEHVAAGHRVHASVIGDLRAEIAETGDSV